ncbi:MAG: PD-(D/E)XK nuclease family protein [Nanoarchaeota archaeon]|nr:PD-(D/E)XK nuclease family protein [Nanoarchaeota archaeon]
MKKRVQSPSSIILYRQCPRKYYYKYIVGLPESPSIHLVRGKIAHEVLEHFFDIDTNDINMQNYELKLKEIVQNDLLKYWQKYDQQLKSLGLVDDKLKFYFQETMMMLLNWLESFFNKIKSFDSLSFKEIFKKLTPLREQHFLSKELNVQGFIDTIEQHDNEIHIMDYKTSSHFDMSEDYRLQLGIYALLYQYKYKRTPHKAGIYFLRYKPKYIKVDKDLLNYAQMEIRSIHINTASQDIKDYPKKESGLCKYSSGQCDFYDFCFKK